MFEISLSFGAEYLDAFSIKCINCKIETGLDSETSFNWVGSDTRKPSRGPKFSRFVVIT